MTLRIEYGGKPATAHYDTAGRWLSVHLDKDPGVGSMMFTRISPCVVTVTGGTSLDILRTINALRSGARYITPGSATRDRYLAEADRLEEYERTSCRPANV